MTNQEALTWVEQHVMSIKSDDIASFTIEWTAYGSTFYTNGTSLKACAIDAKNFLEALRQASANTYNTWVKPTRMTFVDVGKGDSDD